MNDHGENCSCNCCAFAREAGFPISPESAEAVQRYAEEKVDSTYAFAREARRIPVGIPKIMTTQSDGTRCGGSNEDGELCQNPDHVHVFFSEPSAVRIDAPEGAYQLLRLRRRDRPRMAQVPAMEQTMEWTRERPTGTGLYWIVEHGNREHIVAGLVTWGSLDELVVLRPGASAPWRVAGYEPDTLWCRIPDPPEVPR